MAYLLQRQRSFLHQRLPASRSPSLDWDHQQEPLVMEGSPSGQDLPNSMEMGVINANVDMEADDDGRREHQPEVEAPNIDESGF